jgi:hypothetical protein
MIGGPLFAKIDSTGGFIGRIAWTNKGPESHEAWGYVEWLDRCWWGELWIIRCFFGDR